MAGKKGMRWKKKVVQDEQTELSIRQAAKIIFEKSRELVPEDCPNVAEPPGKQGGRPSQYCKPVVALILANAIRGLPLETASRLASIEPSVVADWVKSKPNFKTALETALAVSQDVLLGKVEDGMGKNPRLALDVLERRFPLHFAPTKNMHLSGEVNHRQTLQGEVFTSLAGGGQPVIDVSISDNTSRTELLSDKDLSGNANSSATQNDGQDDGEQDSGSGI